MKGESSRTALILATKTQKKTNKRECDAFDTLFLRGKIGILFLFGRFLIGTRNGHGHSKKYEES